VVWLYVNEATWCLANSVDDVFRNSVTDIYGVYGPECLIYDNTNKNLNACLERNLIENISPLNFDLFPNDLRVEPFENLNFGLAKGGSFQKTILYDCIDSEV